MFDSVEFEANCPFCGSKLTGFQTKEGPCILSTLYPGQVLGFYSGCDNKDCDAWINCQYVPPSGIGKVVLEATKGRWDGKPESIERKTVEVEYDPNAHKKNND